MPTRRLPQDADIAHLKHQAKDLLTAHRCGSSVDLQRIRESHPRLRLRPVAEIAEATFTLADAQVTLAREYGYQNWQCLRSVVTGGRIGELDLPHHERIEDPAFRQAVDLMDAGEVDRLARHLQEHRGLITRRVRFEGGNYFQTPSLIAFIAENPIRHGAMPAKAVEIAVVLLDAGAASDRSMLNETLSLVCSGRVVRETGHQDPLIALLCARGADANAAMLPALGHGEFDAVEALIGAGASISLPVAAATGRVEEASRQISTASVLDRHRALALAAQHGRVAIVSLLLEAREDPNRYNPEGCHAHSTPLHQAAVAGWVDVVRVLMLAGARSDIPDLHHRATPLNWARHAGQKEVIACLDPDTGVAPP